MVSSHGNEKKRRHVRRGLRRLAALLSFLFMALIVMLALFSLRPGVQGLQGHDVISEALRKFGNFEKRTRLRMGLPLRGTPDLARFSERLEEKNLRAGAPVFIRIFKQESELEIWMKKGKRFTLFAKYPICRWSGALGPKLKEGDRQSPEGFYTVSSRQLNPNSRWRRSFNLGFPNSFDKSHGRTGSFLMVHGGCGSIGCYAMTDPVIDEIWQLVTTAFKNGQKRFHVHVYPFRMNALNMAAHRDDKWSEFWRDLKGGHDLFEQTGLPPQISVCARQYRAVAAKPGSKGEHAIRQNCDLKLSSN